MLFDFLKYGDKTAIIDATKSDRIVNISYNELDMMSKKAAGLLKSKGIKPLDVVCVYMDRKIELYYFAIGIIRCGAIFCPLFSSFGIEAIGDRISDCKPKLIVTTDKLSQNVYSYNHIIADEIYSYSEDIKICDDYSGGILHYTSGTTGKPKGAMHSAFAIFSHKKSCDDILGLLPSDIYYCTADPAWVTGTTYGIFGPLSLGITMLIAEPVQRLQKFFELILNHKVSVLYTAPTLLRMLMREDSTKLCNIDTSSLKKIFCVGEALTLDIMKWCNDNLGITPFDTWFQTETGRIMISNREGMGIKAGSMGKCVDGIEAKILGKDYEVLGANTVGHLAIKAPWDSMFTGYLGNKAAYMKKFINGFYITGDLCHMDEDGYFYFCSRDDDVINTAGHLVSPLEVESVLLLHESIREVYVKRAHDKLMGEVVKAVIVLKDGFFPSAALMMEYKKLIRERVSPFASPQIIEFCDEIKKTQSGKIIRS